MQDDFIPNSEFVLLLRLPVGHGRVLNLAAVEIDFSTVSEFGEILMADAVGIGV